MPPDWRNTLSKDYYYRGLTKLKEKLEGLTSNEISDKELKDSIESINRIRELVYNISLLRREQLPPINGPTALTQNQNNELE